MIRRFILTFILAFTLTIGVFSPSPSAAQFEEANFIAPDPNITIPGISFTEAEAIKKRAVERAQRENAYIIEIPYLAEYIQGIYRYAVGIAGAIAVIVIVVAGFQWSTSGGNPETISAAKKRIQNAVIGLILLLSSYSILYAINPNLVQFYSLQVPYVMKENLEYQEGGDANNGTVNQNIVTTFSQTQQVSGIYCPGNGGSAAIPQIVQSLEGKVAYRFGGTGGPPNYQETNSRYIQYNTYCPAGHLCFDCSGLLGYIITCAGLTPIPRKSTNILSSGNTEAIRKNLDGSLQINYDQNTVNGTALQPGDILGWKEGEGGNRIGHVIMYIGNGKTVEASGSIIGREPGYNPKIKDFKVFGSLRSYKFTWIRRVSP
jgi:cell wall-associated NlpC family hydrolase